MEAVRRFNSRRRSPWRDDFAQAVQPFAPFRVPPRFLVVNVIQQYALPIAYAGALLIVPTPICDNRDTICPKS